MTLSIELLHHSMADDYDRLICSTEQGLLYASWQYRIFLERLLGSALPLYLVAREGGSIVGALPAFLWCSSPYGKVLNSLPFYGSNGGIVVSPAVAEPAAVQKALLNGFYELAANYQVVSSTIITNPLDPDYDFYEKESRYSLKDTRIGQLVHLPSDTNRKESVNDDLFALYHQKTRNAIRKAQKSGVICRHSDEPAVLETLAALHQDNIQAIGGLAKPWSVFDTIRSVFRYDADYRVYVAERDHRIIAALLVLFFNRTAEYFCPATLEAERVYQPMSLLIYEAMIEAVQRGLKYWNWGGTWLTQGGVYDFKKRWGTFDANYYYYTRVWDEGVLFATKDHLLREYPFFYVVPFSALKAESSSPAERLF